jgi:hypothetical protein
MIQPQIPELTGIFLPIPFLLSPGQHIIVIHKLPEAHALIEEMMIDMGQLVDAVKGRSRHSHPPCTIRQIGKIGKLGLRILLKPPLKPAVIPQRIHRARSEMQFQRNAP